MQTTSGRRGVSRLVAPVAVIAVLAAVVGAYVFLTRAPAAPTRTSTIGPPTVSVQTAVNRLVQDLNDRNVDGMVTFYSPNAVDVWFGNTGGLSGRYVGPEQIRLIYATSVGKTTSLDANLSDYTPDVFSQTNINTTFVINMRGNSTVAGILTARVDVSEEWNWGNPGWQISKENWNYALFDASNIDKNLSGSTTFPQWSVMKMGGNPNLVSEKSFEWHAGPYLAAVLYAFLVGVVAVLALRLQVSSSDSRARTKMAHGAGGRAGPGGRTSDSSTPSEPSRSSCSLGGRLRITSPAITTATPKAAKTSASVR
jgi:hypothetical protein